MIKYFKKIKIKIGWIGGPLVRVALPYIQKSNSSLTFLFFHFLLSNIFFFSLSLIMIYG